MRRVLAALAAVLVLAGGAMPIAPQVAAWGNRWPSMAAGPLAGTPSTAGVPFQAGPPTESANVVLPAVSWKLYRWTSVAGEVFGSTVNVAGTELVTEPDELDTTTT